MSSEGSGDTGGCAEKQPAPKGDLASRLKGRGLELPSEAPALGGGLGLLSGGLPFDTRAASSGSNGSGKARGSGSAAGAAHGPVHVPLGGPSAETKRLFTPLAQQGASAIEEERKRKVEVEKDLLKEVRVTLKRWVQECLAREEKRQKLLAKGLLKCRVQAKWSEGLHGALKQLIASYGGKLAADCEKENGGAGGKFEGKSPAWLPRNEKWLVGFDAAAFEAFLEAHPEVLEPPEARVRTFAEEFVARDNHLEAARATELCKALEARFGPLRQQLLERAKCLAEDAIKARLGPQAKKGTKRKEAPGEKEQPATKQPRPDAPQMDRVEDAAWAAAALAPMGLQEGSSSAPLVRVPAALALPLLDALLALEGSPSFHNALRKTQIGKVVNAYRGHPKQGVAQAARDLVASWKAACKGVAAK